MRRGVMKGDLVVRPADHRGVFFQVLQQTARSQTAVMTVAPGHDAGPEETHGEKRCVAGPGSLATIPAGTPHHVRSVGTTALFFLTVYAPPEY
jgi:mannose-6-phosphate isomerase-like protein (cupin superfamily)